MVNLDIVLKWLDTSIMHVLNANFNFAYIFSSSLEVRYCEIAYGDFWKYYSMYELYIFNDDVTGSMTQNLMF